MNAILYKYRLTSYHIYYIQYIPLNKKKKFIEETVGSELLFHNSYISLGHHGNFSLFQIDIENLTYPKYFYYLYSLSRSYRFNIIYRNVLYIIGRKL